MGYNNIKATPSEPGGIALKKCGGFKMRNSVTKEYRDLISKKLFLEREIGNLPIGYGGAFREFSFDISIPFV